MKLHLKLNNNNNTYYNCKKAYSYNMFLNIIDGGRGIGKTTTMLIQGCLNANKGEEFIYLRRYKPEIKNFVSKDSLGKICDGIIYKGDGAGGYTLVHEDDTVGYCIALSTYRNYKSVNFDKVTMIIFDEAIVKRGGKYLYLNDEVTALLEFISTVQRTRTNLKVFILGNNEDLFNPYYQYFDIPLFEGNIYTDKERGIYIEHAVNNPNLVEMESKTPLFKLIKDTSYGDYHYKNELITNHIGNIIEKPKSCQLLCRLIVDNDTLNLYTYNVKDELNLYVENRNKIINDKIAFALFNNMKVNYYNVDRYKNTYAALVSRLYYTDRVSYDNKRSVNIFSYIIEKI